MRITQYLITAFLIVNLICCQSKDEGVSQKQWVKIEIAGEHAPVYSIFGDIKTSLFVTLYGKILNTQNGGTTWSTKLEASTDFGGMELKGDSLMAISNFEDYYSLDAGETWQLLGRDLPLVSTNSVTTSNGITYRIRRNSNGELGLPSELLQSCASGLEKNVFPFQHSIYSVYLDSHNGLYVGVNNTAVWNPASGFFDEHLENNAAFYYSKN